MLDILQWLFWLIFIEHTQECASTCNCLWMHARFPVCPTRNRRSRLSRCAESYWQLIYELISLQCLSKTRSIIRSSELANDLPASLMSPTMTHHPLKSGVIISAWTIYQDDRAILLQPLVKVLSIFLATYRKMHTPLERTTLPQLLEVILSRWSF